MNIATTRPLVIVAHKHPEAIETQKMKLFEVGFNLDDILMTHVDIAVAMKEANVLVPTMADRVNGAPFNELILQLKVTETCGTRAENFDLDVANKRWIMVLNAPVV